MGRKVYVVGVGMTKFEKPGSKDWDYPDMAKEAGTRALEDAGVSYEEIEQACVVGDRRPYLVALIVPSKTAIDTWAKAKSVPADLTQLAADPAFRAHMTEVVGRVNAKLSVIERIRRFAIAPEGFTIDNEMMTPTMKIRRHKILAAYGAALEALYEKKGAA